MKYTTLAFVANRYDVIWIKRYIKRNPQERVKIFPTHIAALYFMLKRRQPISRIDAYVKPNPQIKSAVPLPLKISQQIIKLNPHLNLLVDVLRAELVRTLSQYYFLYKTVTATRSQKIIIGQAALHSSIASRIVQDFKIKYAIIPPSNGSRVRALLHRLFAYITPVFWFLSHPLELPTFLSSLLPAPSLPKANIIVFSNGLNLASYHSVIKALRRKTTVQIITDRQGFKDKLYLARYGLRGQELPPDLNNQRIRLNQKINLNHLNVAPWFIPISSLRQLAYELVIQIVATSDKKILFKLKAAKKLISQYRPKLVITTHDPGPSALSFVAAAKVKGITTLVLTHGAPSDIHFFYSDYQLIWGKLMRRLLVRLDVPKHKLRLGGHPIYADYRNYFISHPRPSPSHTIGVITTGDGHYEWYQALYFLDLFRVLKQFKRYRIIIRTHSMQNFPALNRLAHHFGLKITLNPHLHLEEFINQADIIITQNSTAALVPLIAHKPTILLDPRFPFLSEGLIKLHNSAFFKPKTPKQLIQIIKQITSGKITPNYFKKQDQYIREFCGPIDAKIGERVAKKLLALIR